MAVTYTENYNLGKQEDHNDKFDMGVITDNADKIDEALAGKVDKTTRIAGLDLTANITATELSEAVGLSDVESSLNNHVADTENPHSVTAEQVGLGNVDNTSDLNKPISTATQTALNSSTYATALESGILTAGEKTYAQYQSLSGKGFVGKTTLENVITGKGLRIWRGTQEAYNLLTEADKDNYDEFDIY